MAIAGTEAEVDPEEVFEEVALEGPVDVGAAGNKKKILS